MSNFDQFQKQDNSIVNCGPVAPCFWCANLKDKKSMVQCVGRIWTDDAAQDIAEYAVMLAVILVLVVGTIRLVGTNANNAFSAVASSIQ